MGFKLVLKRSSLRVAPFLSLSLLLLSNCGKPCRKALSPLMPFFASPPKEAIHIGDTIWLEARIPHVMKDFETGEYANYKNVEFNSGFYFYYFNDTSIYIFREDKPQIANDKFTLLTPSAGSYLLTGNLYRINYLNKADSFKFKIGVVARDTGFFSINLEYNPGSTAHGSPKIDMGDKKCTHQLATLCQTFNNGSSTLHRATARGYKMWHSPYPTKLEYWVYHNRIYFFTVVK